MADLKPRIPSPIPLPNSGSFLGPNTSRAIPKITSRCIGWNNPSSITPPSIGHALDTDKKQRGQKIRRRDQQVRFSHGARPATQANSIHHQPLRRALSASSARSRQNWKNSGDWPMKSPSLVNPFRAPVAAPLVAVGRMMDTGGNWRLGNMGGLGMMRLGLKSSPPN